MTACLGHDIIAAPEENGAVLRDGRSGAPFGHSERWCSEQRLVAASGSRHAEVGRSTCYLALRPDSVVLISAGTIAQALGRHRNSPMFRGWCHHDLHHRSLGPILGPHAQPRGDRVPHPATSRHRQLFHVLDPLWPSPRLLQDFHPHHSGSNCDRASAVRPKHGGRNNICAYRTQCSMLGTPESGDRSMPFAHFDVPVEIAGISPATGVGAFRESRQEH
jgi:hypothetical protein